MIENYRPDVKRRLKIDYPDLKAVNPRIIYASISAYGQTGPYETWPGFDQIAQGMGGLMSVTGLPGQGPVRAGAAVADMTAGLFAALGVMVALLERERSGEGQYVEASLLAAQIFMLDFQAARWLIDKVVPGQAGNNHPTSVPTGVYKTRDGQINIATTGFTDLGALLQGHRRRASHAESGLRQQCAAAAEPRCDECRYRIRARQQHQCLLDRAAERARRRRGTDLCDRRNVLPIRR